MNFVQTRHEPIGPAPRQIFRRNASGCHSETPRPNRPGARYIAFGISHDHHVVPFDSRTQLVLCPAPRNGGNPVAVLVVVPESPDRKLLPESMSPELQLRSQTDISSQQADHRLGPDLTTGIQEGTNSRATLPGMLAEHLAEEQKVGIEKTGEVLGGIGKRVMPQVLPNQRGVGPPVKIEVCRATGKPKHQLGCPGKRFHPGPSGSDQRAIDVEQDDSHAANPNPAGAAPVRQRP